MFGKDGYLVGDTDIRTPTPRRFYQFPNFDLIGPSETNGEKEIAPGAMRKYLASTWRGGEGARRAEMAALTLAFLPGGGRYVPPPSLIGATPGRLRSILHSSISSGPTTPAVGVVWAEPCVQIGASMGRLTGWRGAAYSIASLRARRIPVPGLYSAIRISASLRSQRRNYASCASTLSSAVLSECVFAS